jgi:exopolyphosphatase/guanosine-5'-triphosphate,3'-diphosphate pyrophosphatase
VAELVAVLDLGSNAARFLLARVKPGVGFRVLKKERVQTRLGWGPAGTLPRGAVTATLDAVHDFLHRVRNGRDPRVLAVATAAVRDAGNRDTLLGPLRRHEGVRVRILSGPEEARLAALAAIHSLPVSEGLVADLGGGSLQLTRLREGRIGATACVPLGAVRTTRRFLRHDPPTPRELRALRREVHERLLGALPLAHRGDDLVGLGGTVRELASIHLRAHPGARFRHGLHLRQSDVTAIRERLEALPVKKRRRIPGLKSERADIILAGAIVIEELITLGGYLTLTICTHGVRDGLLLRETFDGAL